MATLLYIIVGLVVLVLFLAIIAPKSYDVSRTIAINAPKEEIWPYLKYLEKQREWSPWAKKDPNMNTHLEGIDGEVGAVSSWKGNKDVGEGEQEITGIVEGERADGALRFYKPMKSESDCYLILNEIAPQKSRVTWGFKGESKFPFSIMLLFMGMDKMVGKDFEEGLRLLKDKVEG